MYLTCSKKLTGIQPPLLDDECLLLSPVELMLFLKRAHKCGFSKELLAVNELLVVSGRVMFKKMKSSTHCLHMLLPPNKKLDYNRRNSDTYVLPQCTSSTSKRSCVGGACSIFNRFVFIVSIVLSLYRLCTLSCTFFHARLMREFNKV